MTTAFSEHDNASGFSSPSATLRRRHILDLDDFSKDEIELVFKTGDAMLEVLGRKIKQVPTLRGKIIANFFIEPSTRTRSSFELAAKHLGASTISLDTAKSSMLKGESFINTLHTLQNLGADTIVIRHPQAGAPYLAAREIRSSILNAGDGWHAHPSQSLLDLYTIRQCLGNLEGLKVTIVGDIKHSRVARSNIWGMNAMGIKITLCAPYTLLPRHLDGFVSNSHLAPIVVTTNMEEALRGADVIMLLRLQGERQESGLLPSIREYVRLYQLTEQRLSLAKPGALVLHPGPINEDIEITPEIASGAQSVIDKQISNGVAIRMALLYLITGGNHAE